MLRIFLNSESRKELEGLRKKRKTRISERSLYVLLNSTGFKVPEIASRFSRHPHTIRKWLKQYQLYGVSGLFDQPMQGRPSDLRDQIKDQLNTLLEQSPQNMGYQQNGWQVNLLIDYFSKQGITASENTIKRALKDNGWVYKRFAKKTPAHAPTTQEKQAHMETLISTIKNKAQEHDIEVIFEDESHFNNDPYVERGWFKQGEKKESSLPKEKRK